MHRATQVIGVAIFGGGEGCKFERDQLQTDCGAYTAIVVPVSMLSAWPLHIREGHLHSVQYNLRIVGSSCYVYMPYTYAELLLVPWLKSPGQAQGSSCDQHFKPWLTQAGGSAQTLEVPCLTCGGPSVSELGAAQHRLAPLRHACMQMNIIAFENACAGGQIQASMEKTYFDMWLRMMHELPDVWEDSYERLK